MDMKSVKQLADLMEQRGLSHIEVCEGEHKISLTKQPAAAPAAQTTAPALVPAPAPQAAAPEQTTPPKPGEELNSPLVGVAYLAPEPEADPFVCVGQAVKKGQTLCIVEAMKVMNEFAAPRDGVVAEICVADGVLVEFGQCLFRLM